MNNSKENNNTFFSVCIPTYNRAHMIGNAIESVMTELYDNYELIICDNASTDDTKAIVDKYKSSKIKYFYYNQLVSMYANHNRCLEKASGQWIVFLHSDDEIIDLNRAHKVLIMSDFQEAIYKPICWSTSEPQHIEETNLIKILANFNGFSPSGTLYPKNILLKLGGFREDNIIADWEILLDACLFGYSVVDFSGSFVKKGFHQGQTTYEISRSGENHIAKTACISRIFHKITEFNKFISQYIELCSTPQIMLLYRYFKHCNLNEFAAHLKYMAINKNKFNYFSFDYVHSVIDDYIGFDKYIAFFQAVKNLEYKLKP